MSVMRTYIVSAQNYDPWENLAVEELLLNRVSPDEAVLYLWQNQHTVVVGRNQNAWRECHVDKLEADGGKLARRLSGGGAVYHDLGNLNFTFLVPRGAYDLHRQLGVILSAARAVGVVAEFSGRNDILAEGRKFSGNAFYHGRNSSYHHGTILIDVDMSVLGDYLNVPAQKMTSKGVTSVKSRVINLRELVPTLSIDAVKEAMIRSFIAEYGGEGESYNLAEYKDTNQFSTLYAKYSSRDWRLGNSPRFDVTYETRFPWGGVQLGLTVSNGVVSHAKIYSDAMEADLIESMADSLVGNPFERTCLATRLRTLPGAVGTMLITEVAEWLEREIL